MRLFIDDIRNPPIEENDDWIVSRHYDDAIRVLDTGLISYISFDHDLGEDSKTGYDIVCWIEQKVHSGEWTYIPEMVVHSANPVGRANIERAIKAINDRWG